MPGYPGAPTKPWYQQGWVIALGAGALVLLTALVGVGTFMVLRTDEEPDRPPVATGESPSPDPDTPSPEPSDTPANDDPPDTGGPGERFEGEGDREISLDLVEGAYYTVHLSHRGGSWWELYSTEGGEDLENLGWGIGDYEGTYALNLFYGEDADGIRIETDGSWTIEVRELSQSPNWPDIDQGTGSTVMSVDSTQGAIKVTGSHDGESNFIVWAYVEDGFPSLLYNEIGAYEGKADLPAGTFAISIVADGNWSIQPD